MNNLYRHILLIGLITAITGCNAYAQKAKIKTTRIRLEYFQDHEKIERLVAVLRIKDQRYLPFSNVEVLFYCINDTSSVLLDKIRTNENGEAIFIINDNPKITSDSSGLITFEVEYKGTNSIKSARRRIAVRQAILDVSFFQKDTIKSIEVIANKLGGSDQISPIKNLDIQFYIKGTFSQLQFDKGKSDENGKVVVEFPVYMPGDTLGILTIVAKIEDDDTYGTIESMGEINWGIPIQLPEEKRRGLGDTDAPLWMVYTLIILLSAVWFHYMYVIFMIIKIKLVKGNS